ncbi:hypothetical protein Tco_1470189 [Tanacetum coccineum]
MRCGDNDEPWFLPDILVNVRRSGDDAALGVIREVLLSMYLEENNIEIDEPVLVVPTSSHTKRKEEIGKRTDRQKLFDDDNAKINLLSSS